MPQKRLCIAVGVFHSIYDVLIVDIGDWASIRWLLAARAQNRRYLYRPAVAAEEFYCPYAHPKKVLDENV